MTIAWLLLTLLCKWLPHTANYSPEIAMTVYLATRYSFLKASILTIATVEIADMGVALFYGYPFWGSWSVVNAATLLGIILLCTPMWLKNRTVDYIGKVFLAALFYWGVTNLGVWGSGTLYPMTVRGFLQCYTMALPFLPAQLLSALAFASLGVVVSWVIYRKRSIINRDVSTEREVNYSEK